MRLLAAIAFATLLGSCTMAPPPYPPPPRGVAQELVGRVAGAPQRCVSNQLDGNMRAASGDPSTLIYGSGKTIWANHLAPGCRFNPNDVLVLSPFGSSYCENDLVRSIDPSSHIPGRSCVMEAWIPYRR